MSRRDQDVGKQGDRIGAQKYVNAGLQAASRGDWHTAASEFSTASNTAPEWADCHHNLSIALTQLGDIPGALSAAHMATRCNDSSAATWLNLGNLAAQSNELETAVDAFHEVLKFDRNNAAAHLNMGLVLSAQRSWRKAASHLKFAHEAMGNPIQTAIPFARALRLSNQSDQAIDILSSTLDQAPHMTPAHVERARAHLDAGENKAAETDIDIALARNRGDIDAILLKAEVLERTEQWPKLDSLIADAHQKTPDNLAIAEKFGARLIAQDKPQEALALAQRICASHPQDSSALNLLGTCHWENLNHREAIDAYEAALKLNPTHLHALQNLSSLYFEIHDYTSAQRFAEQTRAEHPSDQRILNTLSRVYLARGRLADGWDLGEHPNNKDRIAVRSRINPERDWWDKDLKGKTLRVRPEQGIGDELRFATCFSDVIAEAGKCIIECDPRLAPALHRTFPGGVFYPQTLDDRLADTPPEFEFDLECVAGSLPRRYRRTIEAFPRQNVTLKANPVLNAKWRKRLDDLGPTFKVGLCWRSNVVGSTRIHRFFYTHLDDWKEIYDLEGISFVNLFPGDAKVEIEKLKEDFGVTLNQWSDLDLMDDIEDILSLIHELDLVITVQAAVWTFAGALGKDSIALLNPYVLMGQDRVPWFPSIDPVTSMWS